MSREIFTPKTFVFSWPQNLFEAVELWNTHRNLPIENDFDYSDPDGLDTCFLGVRSLIFFFCSSRCPRGSLSFQVLNHSICHHRQHKHS